MKVINLNDITRSFNLIPKSKPLITDVISVNMINEMTNVKTIPNFTWSFSNDYFNISLVGNTFSVGEKYTIHIENSGDSIYYGKVLVTDGQNIQDFHNYELQDEMIYYTIGTESNNNNFVIMDTDYSKVPYLGAIMNTNLGNWGLSANYIALNTITPATSAVGRLTWNEQDGTLDLGLKGGNVTLQIGQEQVLRVVNKTGIDLLQSEYRCVYLSGSQGNRLKVDLAIANNTVNSNKTIGLVTENINSNNEGFVTTSGLVRDIDTRGIIQGETWLDGDILYLNPTIPGFLSNVLPISPNHKVLVGYVVRAHQTQGSIFVKVDTGLSLYELHDVNIVGVTNSQVLSYNNGIWENKSVFNGSLNYISKFTTSGLTNSRIFDNGTNVGIGTATPGSTLEIAGVLTVNRLGKTYIDG